LPATVAKLLFGLFLVIAVVLFILVLVGVDVLTLAGFIF
jgi:hypothetical protein